MGRTERNNVYWLLGMKVSVVLGPPAFVRSKPCVAFSGHGQTPIADPKRNLAIRKRLWKNWWKQHWRRLQEDFAVRLADGQTEGSVPLDGPQTLVLVAVSSS